jgi:glycosyltransferase involved in cell wall biosynthesis
MRNKKIVFVFIDWFDPAYKAGGPIIASINFVDNMKTSYELFIFTGNKDLGEKHPLKNIISDVWTKRELNVNVFYASDKYLAFDNIKDQLRNIAPDYVYINSIYSKYFSLFPLLIKRFGRLKSKIIVAPRGMLKKSAVNHKRFKKIIFLKLFRLLNLHNKVVFQTTDETERNDVEIYFGKKNEVYLIPDFVAFETSYNNAVKKEAGEIRMIFVGRIHPIKNLYFLLECLEPIKKKILLTIVGNIEDKGYWQECSQKIQNMPLNITVDMKNDLPHENLRSIILNHHLFILPTKGENFGHAIFEALTLGKPVIISNQTPWRNLYSDKAGWDLPLGDQGLFIQAIEHAISWDQADYNEWSKNAWCLTSKFVKKTNTLASYIKLFS